MVAISALEWRPGLAIAAAQLPAGTTRSLNLQLFKNTNYAFIATAEQETTDVDLYLRDAEGQILLQDQETDGTPVIEFQVERNGTYQVQVHVAAGDSINNFIALSLLQSSGNAIIERDYRLLSNRFFTTTSALLRAQEGLKWLDSGEGWPLLGFVLPDNTPLNFSGLRFPPGNYQMVAAGSTEMRDLALYLANHTGAIIARSGVKSPYPLLEFQASNTRPHRLRVAPRGIKSPALIFFGVLQN